MKFVIAPDSFKESMTAITAAEAMHRGLMKVYPHAQFSIFPMADGGEGTVDALLYYATDTKKMMYSVKGPLGESVDAEIGYLPLKDTVIIEMAQASGIMLVKDSFRNPLYTTTYGVGELLIKSLDLKPKKVIIGIGGSSTNDGGVGFLQAIGIKVLDKQGQNVPFGGIGLHQIDSIDFSTMDPRVMDIEIIVLSDVKNPLLGKNGSSYVFSPQKGATHEMVVQLEAGMEHYATILEKTVGKKMSQLVSSGAAGGLGFALYALKNVKIISGIEYLLTQSHIETEIRACNAVFTGEGSIDLQSIQGKVPVGVGMLSKKYDKPVIVMVGKINCDPDMLKPYGITEVYSINEEVGNFKRTLEDGSKNLEKTTTKVASIIDFKEHL